MPKPESNTTLKPCPFCASNEVVELKKTCQCNHCGAQGGYGDEGDGLELWNCRAEDKP